MTGASPDPREDPKQGLMTGKAQDRFYRTRTEEPRAKTSRELMRRSRALTRKPGRGRTPA